MATQNWELVITVIALPVTFVAILEIAAFIEKQRKRDSK